MSELCPVAASVNAMNLEDQPETMRGSLLWLLESKKFGDVIFTFPDLPDRIKAHEFCLKTRSPVFEQIFRTRKSGRVEGNEIEIGESTPEIFQKFLEFIYADNFEVGITQALDVLHLAQKYKVNPLMKKCEQLLLTEILIEDSVKIFETARRYGRRELMDRAGQIMVKSFIKLATSGALANAEEETLIYLLERDDLAVKEVGLFQLILDWGRSQVGAPSDEELLRNKLKNLISKIRYSNMDPYEFTKVVIPTGLLSAEETSSIYSYSCGDDITRRDLKIKFNTNPRKEETREVVKRLLPSNEAHKSDWFPAFSKHSLSFKVDRVPAVGKLLPDYLLTKTVITDLIIWKPVVDKRYREQHAVNLNLLIGDYAGSVQAGSFTIRFQKNLSNILNDRWNWVSVEPPLELIIGRTYSVIVENLSKVDSVEVESYRMDPRAYFLPRISHLHREVQINFEEVCVSLKEINVKTDYYAENLPDFSEEPPFVGRVVVNIK